MTLVYVESETGSVVFSQGQDSRKNCRRARIHVSGTSRQRQTHPAVRLRCPRRRKSKVFHGICHNNNKTQGQSHYSSIKSTFSKMDFRNAVLKNKPQPVANKPVAAAQKEVVVYIRKIPHDNKDYPTDTDQNGQERQKYTYNAATCGDLVDFAEKSLGQLGAPWESRRIPHLLYWRPSRGHTATTWCKSSTMSLSKHVRCTRYWSVGPKHPCHCSAE